MILKALFVHLFFFYKVGYKSSEDCMYKVQGSVLTRSVDVGQDFCHAVNLESLAFLGVQEDVDWY